MEYVTEGKPWSLKASNRAKRSCNPIRKIVDYMNIQPNPELKMINLSIGDPTLGGVLTPHPTVVEAVVGCLKSGKCNGYSPAFGSLTARRTVAQKFSTPNDVLFPDDIILTSGCSAALDLAILGVANAGENILIPMPGFSIFKTLAESDCIECRSYPLLPDRGWEADIAHMESLIDDRTRAIVVNNPSNPCGSVWPAEHIREIVDIAERHRLPIIADELYWEFVFSPYEFISFSSQSKHVPIISCRGIAKCYCVPGWRLGWIQLHDRDNKLAEIRNGLRDMSQRILGPTSIVEAALPTILTAVPKSYFKESIACIENNAEMAYTILNKVPGLKPIKPHGTMYMLVHVDSKYFSTEISDPIRFTQYLIREQSVFCLPAQCFQSPDFIRLVLASSHDETREACKRIATFCKQHTKN